MAGRMTFVLYAVAFLFKCGYEIAGRLLNVPTALQMGAGREPVLHHPGAGESGRSAPGPEHLALLPVPGGGHLPNATARPTA